jgi:protein MBA1
MTWRLHTEPKATIVSHRAQPLGEEQPDTAYRQVVIRLVSTQSLTITRDRGSFSSFSPSSSPHSHSPSSSKAPTWRPDTAYEPRLRKRKDEGEVVITRKGNEEFMENGLEKKVVEYLVMQKRVIRGVEEDWRIWGFATESTPGKIRMDEEYWRRTLDLQTAGL